MGRPKKDCWSHVTKVENGKKWICNYCKGEFGGGASRIEAHLGLEGKRGGIKGCNDYPGNEGVNNNLASTSSNPPQAQAVINSTIYSTHDQVNAGALEVIDTQTSNLVNHQNNLEITNLSEDTVNVGALEGIDTHTSNLVNHQNNLEITNLSEATGANSGGCNRSVCESEINQLKQLVLDLECEENDIAKQLQWLESRGKKRKREVNVWLSKLQGMKGSLDDMNNLNDTHNIGELIQKIKQHKEEKPLNLSTEYVGRKLDENIKKVLKLVDDDKVFVIGIYGMGGVGKTLLATLVENEVKRKSTFKDVFWVTVSHNSSIFKLQYDIAKRIGVNLDEDDERKYD